jgi:hypothetical protein
VDGAGVKIYHSSHNKILPIHVIPKIEDIPHFPEASKKLQEAYEIF